MSVPPVPPSGPSRYELGERLAGEAQKLEGVRRDSWVDQPSLCNSCKHAMILRQASKNSRLVRCEVWSQIMPEDISECTSHAKVGSLSLHQMAEIATIIDDRPDRYRGYL